MGEAKLVGSSGGLRLRVYLVFTRTLRDLPGATVNQNIFYIIGVIVVVGVVARFLF